ncbi:MAG: hypothetical protein FDX18_03085 [Chlorobium sp.]|nr:MAG: hypothetical protein FDX18_03085 [Chlorobium sp.]
MIAATRHIAVLLLVGMFLQVNSVFVYYGLFFLNQKAIAETVCEKKVEHCDGHCFLQKKIADTEAPQPASSEKQSSTKTFEELLNAMPALLPDALESHRAFSSVRQFASGPLFLLFDGFLRQIDHPPNL